MTISRVVVIGHKDHGKSTLIGRILADGGFIKPDRIREVQDYSKQAGFNSLNYAFLTDSFLEERENGLTVDTIQARIRYKGRDFTLIDCPGHKELVKNMLSGATGAQSALLVVSSDKLEGIQDQTISHLEIVRALGIGKLAVAVTKMDSCGYSMPVFFELAGKLNKIIKLCGFNPRTTPIIPVSSIYGENIYKKKKALGWFKGPVLMQVLESSLSSGVSRKVSKLRCLVQDIYRIKGEDWVAGKIISGTLGSGGRLMFMPSGIAGSVKEIKDGFRKVKVAHCGQNIGILLNKMTGCKISRGELACNADSASPVTRKMSVRIISLVDSSFSGNGKYTMDIASNRVECVISNTRQHGPMAFAELKTNRPVVAEKYDKVPELGRFILESRKGPIAAGLIEKAYCEK